MEEPYLNVALNFMLGVALEEPSSRPLLWKPGVVNNLVSAENTAGGTKEQ
jgi:hypothetical protein